MGRGRQAWRAAGLSRQRALLAGVGVWCGRGQLRKALAHQRQVGRTAGGCAWPALQHWAARLSVEGRLTKAAHGCDACTRCWWAPWWGTLRGAAVLEVRWRAQDALAFGMGLGWVRWLLRTQLLGASNALGRRWLRACAAGVGIH